MGFLMGITWGLGYVVESELSFAIGAYSSELVDGGSENNFIVERDF